MKKALSVLLSLFICCSLAACGKSENESVLKLSAELLNKNFKLYSTEYKTEMTLSEYLDYLQNSFQDDSCCYIYEYTLFDLDLDGSNELICRLGVGEDKYFSAVVFHSIGNKIYSYDFTYRGFADLKTDGTVDYSLSGTDIGFRALSFDEVGYTSRAATYSEAVFDGGEIINTSYYVNARKAEKEEFDKAYEKHTNTNSVEFKSFYLDKYTQKYFDFISSRSTGLDKQENEIEFLSYIQDKLPLNSGLDELTFGFYDMNSDGITEMLVQSSGVYAYFTIKAGKAAAWGEIQSIYTYPLKNGNLMLERHGGAPEHINYEYYELDFDGNAVKTTSFSEWHPSAEEGGKAEYFFNDKAVAEDEYLRLAKQYLAYEKAPLVMLCFNELIF